MFYHSLPPGILIVFDVPLVHHFVIIYDSVVITNGPNKDHSYYKSSYLRTVQSVGRVTFRKRNNLKF